MLKDHRRKYKESKTVRNLLSVFYTFWNMWMRSSFFIFDISLLQCDDFSRKEFRVWNYKLTYMFYIQEKSFVCCFWHQPLSLPYKTVSEQRSELLYYKKSVKIYYLKRRGLNGKTVRFRPNTDFITLSFTVLCSPAVYSLSNKYYMLYTIVPKGTKT
jgi:hypothetical protein